MGGTALKSVISLLANIGSSSAWTRIRSLCSRYVMERGGRHPTTVPGSSARAGTRDLKPGRLIRQAGLTVEEFRDLL
jgi:hypothetical protein